MEALDEATHNKVMDLFRKYLLVGGLPDAVNTYLAEKNIQTVRRSSGRSMTTMPPTPPNTAKSGS